MRNHWYEEPRWARAFWVVLILAVCMVIGGTIIGCGSFPPGGGQPPVEPTPPPVDPPYSESCQALIDQGLPWCHVEGMTCGDCIHNPTLDPKHCEKAADCPVEPPPELPQPQCQSFTDRGGTIQPLDDTCDCWLGHAWIGCPVPEPGVCKDVESTLVPSTGCSQVFRTRVKVATTTLGDLTGNDPQENLKTLAAKLIEQNEGLCAFGGIEAVFILRNDGRWEENHTVFFGDGGWTNSGFGKYVGCHVNTAPPPVDPPPVDPPPGDGVCTDPDPTGLQSEFKMKEHGQLWDSTYRVKSFEYCTEAGFTNRTWCPLRNEGDPERPPCEAKHIGAQQWWCDGQSIEPKEGNRAQAACHGHVKTCTEDGRTCAEADW